MYDVVYYTKIYINAFIYEFEPVGLYTCMYLIYVYEY